MIRLEAVPAKPSARSGVEAEGISFYRWALTTGEREDLVAAGYHVYSAISAPTLAPEGLKPQGQGVAFPC